MNQKNPTLYDRTAAKTGNLDEEKVYEEQGLRYIHEDTNRLRL